jgi:TIR domain
MQKAEREIKSAQRKLEADIRRSQAAAERQAERDARQLVRRAEQAMASELQAAGRRLGRQVDAENRKLQRRANSPLRYTSRETEALDAARDAIAQDVVRERDLFLCHAWADRRHAAKDFHEALSSIGLDVWFSEMDVRLGVSLPRQIDRGIAACALGLVLVTPAFLTALEAGGWADKELAVLR